MSANPPIIAVSTKILKRTATLKGILGFRRKSTRGKAIKSAVKIEAIRVVEVTIGTGFMNSPIIPVVRRIGINAQTVVVVVVKTGTKKSLKTKRPVWIGVNFLALS